MYLKSSTNLVVIEPTDAKFDDITIALSPAETISILTATYENYHVKVMTQTNNVENADNYLEKHRQLTTNIIAVKKGDDLVVTTADASKIIFRGFYTLCDTDGACTITLGGEALGGEEAGVTITPNSLVGEALSDGSFIVYTYADSGVLTDMLTKVDGVTLGLTDLPEGTVSYIPTADEETDDEAAHWWWVAGGIALAAVGIKANHDNTVKVTDLADTAPPTIAIDAVATDNIINANEVTATITGTVEEDSSVTLSLGGNVRTVTVSGTTWSYTLIPADITNMGEGAETITVTATDTAGNKRTYDRVITVDTMLPTITIDDITADNTINLNEVTATITGTVDDTDSTVKLSFAGQEPTADMSGTTWSYTLTEADITAMGQGDKTITATATDIAGNEHTASHKFTVDTVLPTVVIDAITTDNTINLNEVTATITGSVNEAVSTVKLNLAGHERMATVLVSESGSTWSYTLTPADITNIGEGAETIMVTATDTAGNEGTASQDITVDTLLPTITIDAITADNIINLNEVTATITGSVEAGSSVKLSLDGHEPTATVSVSGTSWSYTLTPADIANMGEDDKTITATATDTAGNEGTASRDITVDSSVPIQTVTIGMVNDDVNTHGSAVGALATGATTDDTTPTLTGILTTALTSGQVLAIYDDDGTTKLGEATVTDTDWTYTPSALAAGGHRFTAQVENPKTGQQSSPSNAHVINVNSGISMTVTDDVGVVNPAVRYILLKQTGVIFNKLFVNEVKAFTLATNILKFAVGVTAGYTYGDGLPEGVIDGSTERNDGFISNDFTNDNWLLIDLGYYNGNISHVEVYALSPAIGDIQRISHVDVFASNEDLSSQTYAALTANSNAIRLGGTGEQPTYITTLTTPVISNFTDDRTPTLSGTLTAALVAGEELAIYQGTTKLSVVTVNGDNSWTFTTDALPNGSHTFTTVIQAAGESDIANGRVISAAYTISIFALPSGAASTQASSTAPQGAMYSSFASSYLETAPYQAIVTMQVNDDVGALTGKISAGTDTDDVKVSLTGTVTGFDADGAVRVYHGATLLGDATLGSTVDGVTSWSYVPAALEIGSHTIEALAVDDAGTRNSANKASTTFTVTATDTTFSAIATTDPLSGLSVQTYSLASTAMEQTLDFSGAHPEINVINIAGSGANTVKIDLDDVLQSGINLFNDANGWAGLDGTDKHQLVVNGDADDTIELAGSWILAGTTTNSEHTYDVYHLDSTNADGRSQVLIDQDMHVL